MTPFFGGDHASLESDWCSCSPSNNMCSYYGPWFSNNEWHTFSCISTSQFSSVQGATSFGLAVLRRLGRTLRGDIQSCDGGILGLSSDLAFGAPFFFSSLKDQKRISSGKLNSSYCSCSYFYGNSPHFCEFRIFFDGRKSSGRTIFSIKP